MTAKERREKILSLVNNTSTGSVKTSELATQLSVTTETIRKDLIYLENHQLIKKFHGGAKPIAEFVERSLGQRLSESIMSKQEIARTAAAQIKDCSVIFIDAGSTTREFAQYLAEQWKLSLSGRQFAIVTNSFAAAGILLGMVDTLFFIGGEANDVTQATNGLWALNELRSITIDIAFLGTSGVLSHNGPCTKIGSDALTKSEVIRSARKVIVLADHTKFTSTAILQYASWSDIDLLITDSNADMEYVEEIREHVEVMVAEPLGNMEEVNSA